MRLYFLDQDASGRSLKVTDVCLYEKSRSRCQRPTRRGLTETLARRFEGTMKKQQLRPNNTWQTCQQHKSRKLARRAKVNTGDVSSSELLTHCFWARAALRKRRSCRCARFFPQLLRHNGKNNSSFQSERPAELLSHRMDANPLRCQEIHLILFLRFIGPRKTAQSFCFCRSKAEKILIFVLKLILVAAFWIVIKLVNNNHSNILFIYVFI